MVSSYAVPVRPLQPRLRLFARRRSDSARIGELVDGLERGDKHQVLLGVTGSGKTFTMAQTIAQREPADAGDGPQQDAGGPALPGVPALLPRQRRRVLRQLLRLLPARGLRPGHRLVHREGSDDQRRDRSDAPVGDAVAVRAPRRHHRRQRVVHLRPRLAGGLLRHAAAARARPAHRPRATSCASWSRSSTSATTSTSAAAPSASAATSSRCIPSYEEQGLRIELFGDEVDALTTFDPLTGKALRRHDKIAVYPKSHFVAPRERTKRAVETIKEELVERRGDLEKEGRAARGAAAAPADDVRPRDDPGDRLLPRHRELRAPPDRPRSRASRRRRCSTTCRRTR